MTSITSFQQVGGRLLDILRQAQRAVGRRVGQLDALQLQGLQDHHIQGVAREGLPQVSQRRNSQKTSKKQQKTIKTH